MPERFLEVEKFVRNLSETEYVIDVKANDIPYGESTVAQELRDGLAMYESEKKFSLAGVPTPDTTSLAFTVIMAAFSHGVVIVKSDLRKNVRDLEKSLEQCESEKGSLKKDLEGLLKKYKQEVEKNKYLEGELRRLDRDTGDVSG